MTAKKEYPESLKKLVKTNDELHKAFDECLKDSAYPVQNKCIAASNLTHVFACLDAAKGVLGWESEATPEPEQPENDAGE